MVLVLIGIDKPDHDLVLLLLDNASAIFKFEVHLGGVNGPQDAQHTAQSLFERHCLASLAIATLTALCGESTGGNANTATVLF
jgi:hypothetical protein